MSLWTVDFTSSLTACPGLAIASGPVGEHCFLGSEGYPHTVVSGVAPDHHRVSHQVSTPIWRSLVGNSHVCRQRIRVSAIRKGWQLGVQPGTRDTHARVRNRRTCTSRCYLDMLVEGLVGKCIHTLVQTKKQRRYFFPMQHDVARETSAHFKRTWFK